MEYPFEHDPGSPEAIEGSCTCPPQSGPGAVFTQDGSPGYLCDRDCPMHGIDVVTRALAAGEARLLGNADAENDNEPTLH
jgi:hypothetical protein